MGLPPVNKEKMMYSKRLLKQAIGLAGVFALAVLFLTCLGNFQSPEYAGGEGKVAVTIAVAGRTVLPNVSLADVAAYKLSGGKDGAAETLIKSFSTEAATVSLEPGTWSFTLDAYDGDEGLILRGHVASKQINSAGSNQIDFYLSVVNSGEGAVQITINFPAAASITKVIAQAGFESGGQKEFAVTGGAGQFVYTKSGIEAGDYFTVFKLFSGSELRRTVSELVLVRSNVTSSKSITLAGADLKPLAGAEVEVPEGGTIVYVSSQAGLESIRDHIDDPAFNYGKNAYVLQNDIELEGEWTPIGYVESVDYYGTPTGGIHAFSGNFYGNEHTISNLKLPGGSVHCIGLFGFIDDALIQDLQVEFGSMTISITNTSSQRIGIIAGLSNDSIIRNCGVYSQYGITINNGDSGHSIEMGGISCRSIEGNVASIIENCYVSMDISITFGGTHICIGGITFDTINVKNCYYIGNITGTGTYAFLHGISFAADSTQMSYSAGTITNNASNSIYTSTSGITNDSLIGNCVTLMKQVVLTNSTSNYARISCTSTTEDLTNNYAFSGMLLKGATVSSSDPDSQNGLDKTAAQLKLRSTYEDGLGWDFDTVWEMGPEEYPFPIFKWQNGVVKLPDGFSVIQD